MFHVLDISKRSVVICYEVISFGYYTLCSRADEICLIRVDAKWWFIQPLLGDFIQPLLRRCIKQWVEVYSNNGGKVFAPFQLAASCFLSVARQTFAHSCRISIIWTSLSPPIIWTSLSPQGSFAIPMPLACAWPMQQRSPTQRHSLLPCNYRSVLCKTFYWCNHISICQHVSTLDDSMSCVDSALLGAIDPSCFLCTPVNRIKKTSRGNRFPSSSRSTRAPGLKRPAPETTGLGTVAKWIVLL